MAGGVDYRMLKTQYRMHASVCSWASGRFYDSEVVSDGSVANRLLDEMDGVRRSPLTGVGMLGIKVSSPSGGLEKRGQGGELSNSQEAAAAVAHLLSLLRLGVPASALAVISPYLAQVELIRSGLARAAALAGSDDPGSQAGVVEVATVDSFQGREAEAVVLSLVRSNKERRVGFLGDERRLNVAVTRARRHLAVVCDPDTVTSSPAVASLLDHIAREGQWEAPQASAQGAFEKGVVYGTRASVEAPR